MTDLVRPSHDHDQTSTPTDDAPRVGRWYMVAGEDTFKGKTTTYRWLGCVTHVGSNYVELEGPSRNSGHLQSTRVHFDHFWEHCEHVPDPDPVIDGQIARHQARVRSLMEEVRGVTARLGVAERLALPQGDDVRALSLRTSEPTTAYKIALVKAKEETLPALFAQIKEENAGLGQWMKVKLIPLQAESNALKGVISQVGDRIFSVELYAGLVEQVVQVRDGEPAPNDTPVHLMQRRCYMDEECLADYEVGGMDYKGIEDFDRWLSKSNNFKRVLPHKRTLVAFRVRRTDKERHVDLGNLIQVMYERQWDKQTFLYVRNGERLYRMTTEIEFDERLFPDVNHKIFTSQKLWCRWTARDISDVISDEEYQGRLEDERKQDEELKKVPEKDRWRHRRSFNTAQEYMPFTPDNVRYDDISDILNAEKKRHNRLVLVMQGLLDRSTVLHPHPPWQLWTPEGFAAAFRLIYDDTRALSAGDKPDFEKYRAKLNSFLASGSITIGQEHIWLRREAERENKRRESNHSYGQSDWRELSSYRPSGDPGPGKFAHVASYDAKVGSCTYEWKRAKRGRGGYAIDDTEVAAKLVTGEENVLNVDAYRPGDYHLFFDDPRTRQEYLRWAPILLEAEECHAGNRELKPARALPPQREVVARDAERPEDLEPVKPAKPAVSIAEKWEGKMVVLVRNIVTVAGTKFVAGEELKVTSYYRRRLSLEDPKDRKRGVRKVELSDVRLLS